MGQFRQTGGTVGLALPRIRVMSIIVPALNLVLLVLLLPALLACVYLLVLTLLSAPLRPPLNAKRTTRFDILVPAHNEALVLERTLASLQQLDWPKSNWRLVVIADNCTDATAEIARQQGATVLERCNTTQRGKGYALEFGIRHCLDTGQADAFVVIDADTEVSANLLSSFASWLTCGADAIQAHYGVLNPDESWRTRLMTIAYSAFHAVRSRGRERLGVSCGLRGNGMCFSRHLMQTQPPEVYSLAEDVEYGVLLGLNNIRVHYADEAQVLAELPTSRQGTDSQRQRWETGRFLLIRTYAPRLLRQAWQKRSALCLDLALDLLTLPLAYVVTSLVLTAFLAGAVSAILPDMAVWLWGCLGLFSALILHVFRGWQLCPLGPSALLTLLRVPFFIIWKLILVMKRHDGRWIRTKRNDRQ